MDIGAALRECREKLGDRMIWKFMALALIVPLAGCVTAGSEGMTANQIDFKSASASERRAAVTEVRVVTAQPSNMRQTTTVSTRRCHRNFTEAAPTLETMTADLQLAAYSKGGDAIMLAGTKKLNGIAADCWYVIEATALVYQR